MTITTSPLDPVALLADLIRCPSVTPEEGGALQLLEKLLSGAGFDCRRVDRNGIANLFARWGRQGANRTGSVMLRAGTSKTASGTSVAPTVSAAMIPALYPKAWKNGLITR